MEWLLGFGGLILSAFTFLAGKNVAETQSILAEKRRVYEAFLRSCPIPHDAYLDREIEYSPDFQANYPVLLLYAAPSVAAASGRYLELLAKASLVLNPSSPPLHASYREVSKAYNDIILEMRRDAFAWSLFAHTGKSRLPEDILEQAKKNTL